MSSAYDYGYVYYISAADSSQNLVNSLGIGFAGSGVEHDCEKLSTVGYWEDPQNWDTGVVPASNDEVTNVADCTSSVDRIESSISCCRLYVSQERQRRNMAHEKIGRSIESTCLMRDHHIIVGYIGRLTKYFEV